MCFKFGDRMKERFSTYFKHFRECFHKLQFAKHQTYKILVIIKIQIFVYGKLLDFSIIQEQRVILSPDLYKKSIKCEICTDNSIDNLKLITLAFARIRVF